MFPALTSALRQLGPSKAPAVFGRGTDFCCALPKLFAKFVVEIRASISGAVLHFREHPNPEAGDSPAKASMRSLRRSLDCKRTVCSSLMPLQPAGSVACPVMRRVRPEEFM